MHPRFHPTVLLAFALVFATSGHPSSSADPAGAPVRPAHVTLASAQTPLKRQGARGTCTAFGAVAALEAAYRRRGLGELDLSEEFLAYFGKAMWIETQWSRAASHGTDVPENSVAAATGSTGTFLVEMLWNGFAIPTERDLPYRDSYAGTLDGHESIDDPWWKVTWNVDLWNHDRTRVPRAALAAPAFHRVADYRWIYLHRRPEDSTYAERFEEILAGGHEIVWDCFVRNGETDAIWRYDAARAPTVGHCMLIVGYDRSSRDPLDHHFLVKNSWGPTTHADGLTRVSYDFLRYGAAANVVLDVTTPAPWAEARFVGRWHLSLDGKPSLLAWNRVPGVLQRGLDETRAIHPDEPVLVDRRVGNLYPEATVRPVLRVNGEVRGSTARLWFDPETPRLRYDERRGRTLDVRLLDGDPTVFVGRAIDAAGVSRPCYGRLDGALGRAGPPRERSAADLAGSWRLVVDGAEGRLDFGVRAERERSPRSARLVLERFGFDRPAGLASDASNVRVVSLTDELPLGGRFTLTLELLGSEDGVLVGEARVAPADGSSERVYGAYAVRMP